MAGEGGSIERHTFDKWPRLPLVWAGCIAAGKMKILPVVVFQNFIALILVSFLS